MPGTFSLKTTQATGRLEFSQRHKRTCVADASGNFSLSVGLMGGSLMKVQFIPGTGALQPAGAIAAQLLDEAGEDLFQGLAAAIPNVGNTEIRPAVAITDGVVDVLVPPFICDDPTLTITGLGANKAVTVHLVVR